jgi:hypothetical protein
VDPLPPLRIRRADTAPGTDEFFARLPESAITDHDLSDAAFRLLAAIHLDCIKSRTPKLSLASNRELGWLAGKDPRTVRRLLAELVARGHLEVEHDPKMSGSTRSLRPLARLRPTRPPRSEVTAPPRSEVTAPPRSKLTAPRSEVTAPRSKLTAARSEVTTPLREREKKQSLRRPAASAAAVEGPPPPPAREPETQEPEPSPEEIAEARAMAGRSDPVGALARSLLQRWGIAPAARDAAPGPTTTPPPGPSRSQHRTRPRGQSYHADPPRGNKTLGQSSVLNTYQRQGGRGGAGVEAPRRTPFLLDRGRGIGQDSGGDGRQ